MSKRQKRRERGRSRARRDTKSLTLLMADPETLAAITRASEQARAAIASLGVAFSDLGAAMSNFGSIGASGIQRMIEIEEQAMRLSTLTPLVPEDARALILEYGSAAAEEISRYVAMGFSIDVALERVRSGLGSEDAWRLPLLTGESSWDAPQADPIADLQRAMTVFRANRQPQSPNPCQSCANYVGGKYRSDDGDRHPTLICGIHPYGPDGNDCPDWESTETPEAQRRSKEARERSRNAEREAARRRQGWRRPSVRDVFWRDVFWDEAEAAHDPYRVRLRDLQRAAERIRAGVSHSDGYLNPLPGHSSESPIGDSLDLTPYNARLCEECEFQYCIHWIEWNGNSGMLPS
ncbi:MAG: hypothetical protein AAFN08_05875, partial [Cyanobacteria bacterium J06559_3]